MPQSMVEEKDIVYMNEGNDYLYYPEYTFEKLDDESDYSEIMSWLWLGAKKPFSASGFQIHSNVDQNLFSSIKSDK